MHAVPTSSEVATAEAAAFVSFELCGPSVVEVLSRNHSATPAAATTGGGRENCRKSLYLTDSLSWTPQRPVAEPEGEVPQPMDSLAQEVADVQTTSEGAPHPAELKLGSASPILQRPPQWSFPVAQGLRYKLRCKVATGKIVYEWVKPSEASEVAKQKELRQQGITYWYEGATSSNNGGGVVDAPRVPAPVGSLCTVGPAPSSDTGFVVAGGKEPGSFVRGMRKVGRAITLWGKIGSGKVKKNRGIERESGSDDATAERYKVRIPTLQWIADIIEGSATSSAGECRCLFGTPAAAVEEEGEKEEVERAMPMMKSLCRTDRFCLVCAAEAQWPCAMCPDHAARFPCSCGTKLNSR